MGVGSSRSTNGRSNEDQLQYQPSRISQMGNSSRSNGPQTYVSNGQHHLGRPQPGGYPAGQLPQSAPQEPVTLRDNSKQYGQPPPTNTVFIRQTSKVRNPVDLVRKTLKLVPVQGKDGHYYLQFSFNSVKPCSVSVFYLATEDPSQQGKITSKLPVGTRSHYPAGMNQHYPPAADIPAGLIFETTNVPDQTLSQVSALQINGRMAAVYPIIIRLESRSTDEASTSDTTDDKQPAGGECEQQGGDCSSGAAANEAGNEGSSGSLEELEVGCSQPAWAQNLTTFAVIKKLGSELTVRVVKQKIWHMGLGFDLQEIYGLSKSSVGDNKDQVAEGRECVVCMENLRDTTIIPCRHLCICMPCSKVLLQQKHVVCPICRNPIDQFLRISPDAEETGKGIEAQNTS